ncbi:MAG: carboxypeptidase regulatory-like domain-containing protein [Candidatus Acidiferrum sp.]
MFAPSGASMRRSAGSFSIQALSVALGAVALLFLPQSCAAQSVPNPQPVRNTRGIEDYASGGQVTVHIQDSEGGPFFQGAKVSLLTSDIAETFSAFSDPSGHARFTGLPVGHYLVEVVAPGYRTVQAQVLITTTNEAQKLEFSLVPKVQPAPIKRGSRSVSAKAVKESDKAARALEINALDEAQQQLERALSIDPTFADANYLMALVMLRRSEPGRAVGYLQESLKLSPNHAAALLTLGEAQYLEGDYAHAGNSLETYLAAAPTSPQAVVAQKYLEAIRRTLQLRAASASESVSTTSDSSSSSATERKGGATSAAPDPPPPDLTPDTEMNWAPPDVDTEKLDLDSAAPCQLNQVLHAAAGRVRELVQNVDRFTATEQIEHSNLSPMGLETSRETHKFDYLVEIRQVDKTDLDVQEYRNGSVAIEEFPGHIATVGLPTLALIFHPYLQPRYEFQCEGQGSWHGRAAWVVHFRQRTDRASGMLTYHVGNRFVNVGLKGRAWIDVGTSQILAMESDITRPAPEIRLLRDHQLIEYGPVGFRNKSLQLWLPKSADWYCSISGQRFHRRHTFSQFLLFSVDDKQTIKAPPEPVKPENPQ